MCSVEIGIYCDVFWLCYEGFEFGVGEVCGSVMDIVNEIVEMFFCIWVDV